MEGNISLGRPHCKTVWVHTVKLKNTYTLSFGWRHKMNDEMLHGFAWWIIQGWSIFFVLLKEKLCFECQFNSCQIKLKLKLILENTIYHLIKKQIVKVQRGLRFNYIIVALNIKIKWPNTFDQTTDWIAGKTRCQLTTLAVYYFVFIHLTSGETTTKYRCRWYPIDPWISLD